jgi:hypothetical protein
VTTNNIFMLLLEIIQPSPPNGDFKITKKRFNNVDLINERHHHLVPKYHITTEIHCFITNNKNQA